MTFTGDWKPWAKSFPLDRLPLVFRVVIDEWPGFTRPRNRRILENQITNRFVGHLQRTALRRRDPFAFRFRSKFPDPDADAESGELDIEVFVGYNPHVYFAFECKRLRVHPNRSGATEYVGDRGMGRFISGRYDGHAGCGGMIGYVMDNDVHAARTSVNEAIPRRHQSLRLLPPRHLHPAAILPDESGVHQTRHIARSGRFLIYHLFLPLQPKASKPRTRSHMETRP